MGAGSSSPSSLSALGAAPLTSPCSCIKSILSIGLLLFSIVVVMALIFDKKTSLSQDVHPALAFFVLWIAMIWLSHVEGGQASLVGLPPIDRELYKRTHYITYHICKRAHYGDNLDRYLMGRQFMVLALVFVINMSGLPVANANVLGLPEIVAKVFLDSGLALILMTCMLGQLSTQINASHCMLDFINDWGNWFTVQFAFALEASGLLHASYLIQMVVCNLARQPIESNEDPRTHIQSFLFWIRVVFSCIILVVAFVVTIAALFKEKTTMWDSVPNLVSLVLFFILVSVVGMLEGMQIAFFSVAKLTEEQRGTSPWASRTCALLFEGERCNLPGFMVGRQLAVVACFFVVARVTSLDVNEGEDNLFGVPNSAQAFFNTGLLGALITTIVGSIAWQLVASAFPLAFLSNPLTYLLLRLCLFLESTGVCHGAWVLAAVHRNLAGFQVDEYYVGTADERAAIQRKDKEVRSKAGGLAGGAFPANHGLRVTPQHQKWMGANFVERRVPIMRNIKMLNDQIDQAPTLDQKRVFEAALEVEKKALRNISREEAEYRRLNATGITTLTSQRLAAADRARDSSETTTTVILSLPPSDHNDDVGAQDDVAAPWVRATQHHSYEVSLSTKVVAAPSGGDSTSSHARITMTEQGRNSSLPKTMMVSPPGPQVTVEPTMMETNEDEGNENDPPGLFAHV